MHIWNHLPGIGLIGPNVIDDMETIRKHTTQIFSSRKLLAEPCTRCIETVDYAFPGRGASLMRDRVQSSEDVLAEAELLDTPGGQSLRLRFQGRFEDRMVTWLATLHALDNRHDPATPAATAPAYIEVGTDGPDGIPVTAGLQVERIDLPTVRKAIIMIRRYKALRRGRYEYGARNGV